MGTELLRVRTAVAERYEGGSSALAQSVQQLRDEIDSIAEALEELQHEQSSDTLAEHDARGRA